MSATERQTKTWRVALMLAWIVLLAVFFAETEIQIEGASGWAASLPTWRIEKHWLLDLFWGGRAMTGYHAWVFPCVAMFFHFPFFMLQQWSWRLEARAVASIMLFWVCEDFLWFMLNPAYGLARFHPGGILWHQRWLAGLPADYWLGLVAAALLFPYSYRKKQA
jgi:hypothetical protein